MKRAVGGSLGLAFAGALFGGLAGSSHYDSIDNHTALCASCHHGTTEIEERQSAHSTDFASECHTCHVLPVKEYLAYTIGEPVPDWVHELENPVIAQQTCEECHLQRGRGLIECHECHVDGSTGIDLTAGCESCHSDRHRLAPHDEAQCRSCHVEAYLGHEQRVRVAMRARKEQP